VIVASFTTLIFFILRSLCKRRKDEDDKLRSVSVSSSHSKKQKSRSHEKRPSAGMTLKQNKRLREFAKYFSIAMLCLSGVSQPSALKGLYFIVFIYFSTWLSFNRQLNLGFAWILKALSFVITLHIFAVIFLQFEWFLNGSARNEIMKVVGTGVIFRSTLNVKNLLNPLILITTYLVITMTSHFMLVSCRIFRRF
jgi:hypothetical protein